MNFLSPITSRLNTESLFSKPYQEENSSNDSSASTKSSNEKKTLLGDKKIVTENEIEEMSTTKKVAATFTVTSIAGTLGKVIWDSLSQTPPPSPLPQPPITVEVKPYLINEVVLGLGMGLGAVITLGLIYSKLAASKNAEQLNKTDNAQSKSIGNRTPEKADILREQHFEYDLSIPQDWPTDLSESDLRNNFNSLIKIKSAKDVIKPWVAIPDHPFTSKMIDIAASYLLEKNNNNDLLDFIRFCQRDETFQNTLLQCIKQEKYTLAMKLIAKYKVYKKDEFDLIDFSNLIQLFKNKFSTIDSLDEKKSSFSDFLEFTQVLFNMQNPEAVPCMTTHMIDLYSSMTEIEIIEMAENAIIDQLDNLEKLIQASADHDDPETIFAINSDSQIYNFYLKNYKLNDLTNEIAVLITECIPAVDCKKALIYFEINKEAKINLKITDDSIKELTSLLEEETDLDKQSQILKKIIEIIFKTPLPQGFFQKFLPDLAIKYKNNEKLIKIATDGFIKFFDKNPNQVVSTQLRDIFEQHLDKSHFIIKSCFKFLIMNNDLDTTYEKMLEYMEFHKYNVESLSNLILVFKMIHESHPLTTLKLLDKLLYHKEDLFITSFSPKLINDIIDSLTKYFGNIKLPEYGKDFETNDCEKFKTFIECIDHLYKIFKLPKEVKLYLFTECFYPSINTTEDNVPVNLLINTIAEKINDCMDSDFKTEVINFHKESTNFFSLELIKQLETDADATHDQHQTIENGSA